MPRHYIPVGFRTVPQTSTKAPVFQLENENGHRFSVHPLTNGLVRVVHELPNKYQSRWSSGIQWESSALSLSNGLVVASNGENKSTLSTKYLNLSIDWSNGCPRLQWFSTLPGKESPDGVPFLSDCLTRAYTFDAATGGVLHYVEREDWFPVSEHEPSPASPLGQNEEPFVNDRRNEFVYGLGEASGGILRTARKFTLEARDGAGYDWENGDPLYKVTPFYIVFNKRTQIWCGVYYNSLANDASLDLGAECDALFNGFRTYRAGCGPLDYYVILGDGTLSSVVSTYAALVSPSLGPNHSKAELSEATTYFKPWRASLTLPPRSQFGYLASSLALAAEPHAQDAILDFVKTCRHKGFPIDALHLSTGWCQNPETDNRHYFVWNRQRYPDPHALGTALEQEMNIRIIVNIKPWLLDDHPLYEEALKGDSYVKAAEDAPNPNIGVAKSLLWSNAPGEHMYGSYLDFSSPGAVQWWSRHIKEDIVGMNMTGMWIDNNEFSGLVDDAETYVGKKSFWGGGDWESRLGWGGGEATIGQVGRLIQMMGMAKTTHDTMLEVFSNRRPIIVTRAAVPGMQAYAHGTWSGDNATSWTALRRGTAMTLSAGISFLPGLYGHDIGGFAGTHHPSPELLVRWCQQGAWHTRFTVHSWKEVSTTLWMYDGVEVEGAEITKVLRDVVGFRYQIIPTMYSLYVNEYWKLGWPVLRPMFWYHSADPKTLALDEQFLFGSHILVAPVLSSGHRTKRVYLPNSVNGINEVPEWCELDTGIWRKNPNGGFINMDAPLPRTPVLVRAGGILVLSNKCAETVYDGEITRVAHIFPSLNSQVDGARGSFKLVEDDGKTNEHAEKDAFTELELSFRVGAGEKGQQEVEVDIKELSNSYALPYNVVWFILPVGDSRKLHILAGSPRKTSEQKAEDGRVMLGVHVS